jgi:hypothetical protein
MAEPLGGSYEAFPVLADRVRPDPGLAVGVGLLIGIVTGAIFVLLLLQIATAAKRSRSQRIGAAISECLSLPGFWFGGPWLTGRLLAHGGLDAAVNYYTVTLAAGFLMIAGVPLYRLVTRTAQALRDV